MLDCPEASSVLLHPLAALAIVAAAVVACGGLAWWARRPGHPDRVAVVIAASVLGVVVAILNLVLGTDGVWQSCSYRAPAPVLAAAYLLMPIVFGALLLMGYRWLRRHVRHAAVAYGAVLLVVVVRLSSSATSGRSQAATSG